MSKRSELWSELKDRGFIPHKPFVNWTEEELEAELATIKVAETGNTQAPQVADSAPVETDPYLGVPPLQPAPEAAARVQSGQVPGAPVEPTTLQELMAQVVSIFNAGQLREGMSFMFKGVEIPVKDKGELRAGLTYSHPEGVPIRIDLSARLWMLDEVLKPAIPQARMVRRSRYIDPGVKKVHTYREGDKMDDIVEVAGDLNRELTTTVTLPSYQVGLYHDARFPFPVHTYNGMSGFDAKEVVKYFGGLDLVPGSIKVVYVGNMLTYGIPSVRDYIQSQYLRLQKGSI